MGRGEKRRLHDAEQEEMVACSPDCSNLSPPSIDGESREEVMSEVHLGCPPHLSGPYTSRFTFRCPPPPDDRENQRLCVDDDGDLVLSRPSSISCCKLEDLSPIRICPEAYVLLFLFKAVIICHGISTEALFETSANYGVTIQHNITSSIPSVGLQVWRAALVLADFVLHKSFTFSDFNDIVAIELGAGTGLLGILLARVARMVFLTDFDDNVLGNCVINADLNSQIFKYLRTPVHVRELDWKKSWPPTLIPGEHHAESHQGFRSRARYLWTPSEIEEAEGATLILAADVIYSDDLTDAFFNTLMKLMSCGSEKVLYLALEKRYNFSLDDLDVVANGYLRFRSYLRDEEACTAGGDGLPCFVGKLVDLKQIPQYMREYDRGNDVEIWQIKYAPLNTASCKKNP